MHHSYLDKLAYARSPVHALDARVKLGLAVAAVLVIASLDREELWRLGPIAALVISALIAARLPWLYLFRRSLLVLPFVLAVGALLPFREGGTALAEADLFGWHLAVNDEGLVMLAEVAARSYLAVWVLLILASTTRFAHLLAALQAFAVPQLLVMLSSFLYRYLFVIAGEAMRMRRARDARSAGPRHSFDTLRASGGIVGVLFLRSYERSERVYQAMSARGFDGTVRLSTPLHLHGADWVALGVGMAAVAAVALAPLGGLP